MKETCKTSLFVEIQVSHFCCRAIKWPMVDFGLIFSTLLARYVRSGTAKPKHATQVVLSMETLLVKSSFYRIYFLLYSVNELFLERFFKVKLRYPTCK